MKKPIAHYLFRPVDDTWVDVLSDEKLILADVLSRYNIVIDDRTQFARLYDYDQRIIIWYRAYGCMKVDITIDPMEA